MAVTKLHAPLGAVLAVGAVLGASGLSFGSAFAQDPRILSDITAGNRQVVFEFTKAGGDTLSQAERDFVPDLNVLVDVDLGIATGNIRNGDPVVVRGAGGKTLTDFLIRVGNNGDFFEVGQGPATPPAAGFDLAGAFQMGREYVAVAFTGRANAVQAVDPSHYAFSPSIPIASVRLQDNGRTVIFASTGALPASTTYSVTVTGVTGESGDPLGGSNVAGFQTVSGSVTDIADIHAGLPGIVGQPVTVVGQVYIPAGSRGDPPSGYVQDGSGRGINLFGGSLQAEVNDRGNVVMVTGTVTDTTSEAPSLVAYTPTLVAGGQPWLQAKTMTLATARDTRWNGTYIATQGRLARVDKQSDPDVPVYNLVVTDTLFAGYRIWRADSEDPANFLLLRTYSLLDSTWAFTGDGRFFADPDSIILRGTERDPDAPDMAAGPFNGFGYIYAVSWFDAVVDATTIPSRTIVFERTGPMDGALQEPVYPGNPARVTVPLLGQVKVVPNPYNPYARFGRGAFPGTPRIQFTKLPRTARVSIYNVAGDLVRVLTKPDDPTIDALDWDLRNNDGEEIAPGIYIYRVEAQNETTMGRFVVAGAPKPVN